MLKELKAVIQFEVDQIIIMPDTQVPPHERCLGDIEQPLGYASPEQKEHIDEMYRFEQLLCLRVIQKTVKRYCKDALKGWDRDWVMRVRQVAKITKRQGMVTTPTDTF
jgi:hypothetical protein